MSAERLSNRQIATLKTPVPVRRCGESTGGVMSTNNRRHKPNSVHKQKLSKTRRLSPVMRAAKSAAKVIKGWSDAKKEYAERILGAARAPINPKENI